MLHNKSPLEVAPASSHDEEDPFLGTRDGGSELKPVIPPRVLEFATCFIGLQISYLTWGFCQESLMTTQFNPTPMVVNGKFPSAAFAVFSNRVVAIVVAYMAVMKRHGTLYSPSSAPLLSFAPCALSNTFSSWSQYNALKFVTFPVQTIFKSSKIIPVMLMGKFLKGTVYGSRDYFEAVLITLGVFLFSYYSKSDKVGQANSEAIGIIFLTCYICCDAFTSNWQSKIYQRYGKVNVDSFQMMFGVNSFAIFFTSLGLVTSGELPVIIEFFSYNPVAFWYNIVTSITSATGQLFIFRTIKEFGPVSFSLIMTCRQIFSIVLSSIYFQHAMSIMSLLGATLVFSVIGSQLKRKIKG
mmetsp:Transcript_10305/g.21190  ORF Transcript_10305/g.21190 Transcript_10305/m.21190 type:complete len:354 (+) Transcript_10305:170-1231(+)